MCLMGSMEYGGLHFWKSFCWTIYFFCLWCNLSCLICTNILVVSFPKLQTSCFNTLDTVSEPENDILSCDI